MVVAKSGWVKITAKIIYSLFMTSSYPRCDKFGNCSTFVFVENPRWSPVTGNGYEGNVYLGLYLHYTNGISAVTAMFPGSGNTSEVD